MSIKITKCSQRKFKLSKTRDNRRKSKV